MNKKCLASLLIAATLALAGCDPSKSNANFTGMGPDGTPLPDNGDKVDLSGIPQNARPGGDFDPSKDVDYSKLASDTIYFAFDSSTIPGAERTKLAHVVDWLKANPNHSLFLAGHADKRGTPEYNRALGERRALAVREYLAGLGIPASTLFTISYGSDRPAEQGDSEEAYAKNRRVQIGVIIKQ